MLTALDEGTAAFTIFNLGTDEYCEVLDSVGWIASALAGSLAAAKLFRRRPGWIGDNPLIHLDTSRIRSLGWRPKRSIREAVELTVDWLDANRWIFTKRP